MKGLDDYLDDFSIEGDPKSPQCGHYLTTALETCKESGFSVKAEKMEGPSTQTTQVRFELD